jgi:hypothetical protein
MSELSHTWGNDIALSPSGDLAVVDGLQRGLQRVIRRLMTAQSELIMHQDYGAGVPQRIGQTLDVDLINSVVRSQIFNEDAVAKTPAPVIGITPFLNGVVVSIQYADAVTGAQQSLSFDVKN